MTQGIIQSDNEYNFLAGGGEMGELIRSIDWSKTAVGPISEWSQSLRMMVGLLLRNRFPLILWWGPKFVQFYNDVYRPILVVSRNGLRFLRLVNTLLDFSRIEAGRVQAVFEPTDLAAFTAELASVFRAATEKAGLNLRVDDDLRTIPIILLSARAGEESRIEGLQQGADDYLIKPFSARELMARIVAHLDMARLRKEATAQIRQSEEQLRAFVTASSDVVYRMSPDWKEMRFLQGKDFIPDTDSPSSSWLDKYIHPDDQLQVLSVINEAIRTKSIFELEHRVLQVDGSLGWTFSRAVPLLDENGEITEWVGMASDITERKRAEEALRESEHRLQSVLLGMTDAYYFYDQEWKFVDINQRALEYFGRTREEMIGRCVWDLYPNTVGGKTWTEYHRSMAEGVPVHFETKSGVNENYFEVHAYPETNGLTVYLKEITERKRAEEALQENEEQLKANLDAMTKLQELSILSFNEEKLETILTKIVDVAIAISGADFGNIQLLDSSTSNLVIVAQRGFAKWWLDYWNSVSKGQGTCGTAFECGKRVIVEDVEQSPIFVGTSALEIQRKAGVRAIQSTPLINRSGKLLGMFSTHYKMPYRPDDRILKLLDLLSRQAADIIERMQIEEILRENEERLRFVLKTCQIGVWDMDIKDHTIIRSPENDRVYGYDVMLPEWTYEMWLDHVIPEDRERVDTTYQHAIKTKSSWNFEFRIQRPDGQIRWILATGNHKCEVDGSVRRVAGIVLDITERKQIENDLNRINNELEERVKKRTQEIINERQRLYTVLETLPAYVILLNKDYHIPFANKIFRERFGESHGRCCYDFLFNNDAPCEGCETYKVLKTNSPHRWEWIGPDGRVYDIYDYPFVEADGSTLILEMGIDITEQKNAQESLRSASQYTRNLIEVSLDPLDIS